MGKNILGVVVTKTNSKNVDMSLKDIESLPSADMMNCFDDPTKDVFNDCFPKLESEFELIKSKMDTYKTEMEAEKLKATKSFDAEMKGMDDELAKYDKDFKVQEAEFNLEMGKKLDDEIQKNVIDVFKNYTLPT